MDAHPPEGTPGGVPFATALRDVFRRGYRRADLRADVLAGLTVGIVALPLSMALAIAVGLAPQHGLYTAIVAGIACALAGGSRVQVSGPTAAFVVVLLPIHAEHGPGGLLLASLMAGVLLVIMGAVRLGRFVQVIPYPVVTGFTAGIAVVIAGFQLHDLLGVRLGGAAHHLPERLVDLVGALGAVDGPTACVGLGTLAVLVLWPRISRHVPAPLVGLAAGAVAAWALERWVPGFRVETIADRFSFTDATGTHAGIPHAAPAFRPPWAWPGADGAPLEVSPDLLRALVPPAMVIAALGAIESLLSAVMADAMTGETHDPDAELVGQGLGNVLAPFFGGFAATGALARTATNVKAGARTPLAAVVHALFLLAAMIGLAPLLGHLPMASLAALLLVVAWNMAHVRHVARTIRESPRSDTAVLLVCAALTAVSDMVVAVTVGVALAGVLFVRRIAAMTGTTYVDTPEASPGPATPEGVLLYRIAGPLFFGAAHKAMAALGRAGGPGRVVILDLSRVPLLDATGSVNLESAISRILRDGAQVVLGDLQAQPRSLLARTRWLAADGVFVEADVAAACARAAALVRGDGEGGGPGPDAGPGPEARTMDA